MRTKIDLLIWKYIVPVLHINTFKNKAIQFLAIGYILCYSLPRRFFLHYLLGNGSAMMIDGAAIMKENPHLLAILGDEVRHRQNGSIHISQKAVSDPKWKYSIGSFRLDFSRHANALELSLTSAYNYKKDTSRLTKHLHCFLASSKRAKDFSVRSNPFYIAYNDLKAPLNWNEMKTAAPYAFYLLV